MAAMYATRRMRSPLVGYTDVAWGRAMVAAGATADQMEGAVAVPRQSAHGEAEHKRVGQRTTAVVSSVLPCYAVFSCGPPPQNNGGGRRGRGSLSRRRRRAGRPPLWRVKGAITTIGEADLNPFTQWQ